MEQIINEINAIDRLLCDEIKDINEFEENISRIEDELNDEEKLIAKLHNTARLTIIAIKHLHTLIRRINQSEKIDDHDQDLMRHYLDRIAMNLIHIQNNLDKLEKDEDTGKKVRNYCEKVSKVIRDKLMALKDKFNSLNK